MHKNLIFTAWDLKLANVILGISAHGGTFACLYCESGRDSESGSLRTFGSLGKNINRYISKLSLN